jgi:hypothetical protein
MIDTIKIGCLIAILLLGFSNFKLGLENKRDINALKQENCQKLNPYKH